MDINHWCYLFFTTSLQILFMQVDSTSLSANVSSISHHSVNSTAVLSGDITSFVSTHSNILLDSINATKSTMFKLTSTDNYPLTQSQLVSISKLSSINNTDIDKFPTKTTHQILTNSKSLHFDSGMNLTTSLAESSNIPSNTILILTPTAFVNSTKTTVILPIVSSLHTKTLQTTLIAPLLFMTEVSNKQPISNTTTLPSSLGEFPGATSNIESPITPSTTFHSVRTTDMFSSIDNRSIDILHTKISQPLLTTAEVSYQQLISNTTTALSSIQFTDNTNKTQQKVLQLISSKIVYSFQNSYISSSANNKNTEILHTKITQSLLTTTEILYEQAISTTTHTFPLTDFSNSTENIKLQLTPSIYTNQSRGIFPSADYPSIDILHTKTAEPSLPRTELLLSNTAPAISFGLFTNITSSIASEFTSSTNVFSIQTSSISVHYPSTDILHTKINKSSTTRREGSSQLIMSSMIQNSSLAEFARSRSVRTLHLTPNMTTYIFSSAEKSTTDVLYTKITEKVLVKTTISNEHHISTTTPILPFAKINSTATNILTSRANTHSLQASFLDSMNTESLFSSPTSSLHQVYSSMQNLTFGTESFYSGNLTRTSNKEETIIRKIASNPLSSNLYSEIMPTLIHLTPISPSSPIQASVQKTSAEKTTGTLNQAHSSLPSFQFTTNILSISSSSRFLSSTVITSQVTPNLRNSFQQNFSMLSNLSSINNNTFSSITISTSSHNSANSISLHNVSNEDYVTSIVSNLNQNTVQISTNNLTLSSISSRLSTTHATLNDIFTIISSETNILSNQNVTSVAFNVRSTTSYLSRSLVSSVHLVTESTVTPNLRILPNLQSFILETLRTDSLNETFHMSLYTTENIRTNYSTVSLVNMAAKDTAKFSQMHNDLSILSTKVPSLLNANSVSIIQKIANISSSRFLLTNIYLKTNTANNTIKTSFDLQMSTKLLPYMVTPFVDKQNTQVPENNLTNTIVYVTKASSPTAVLSSFINQSERQAIVSTPFTGLSSWRKVKSDSSGQHLMTVTTVEPSFTFLVNKTVTNISTNPSSIKTSMQQSFLRTFTIVSMMTEKQIGGTFFQNRTVKTAKFSNRTQTIISSQEKSGTFSSMRSNSFYMTTSPLTSKIDLPLSRLSSTTIPIIQLSRNSATRSTKSSTNQPYSVLNTSIKSSMKFFKTLSTSLTDILTTSLLTTLFTQPTFDMHEHSNTLTVPVTTNNKTLLKEVISIKSSSYFSLGGSSLETPITSSIIDRTKTLSDSQSVTDVPFSNNSFLQSLSSKIYTTISRLNSLTDSFTSAVSSVKIFSSKQFSTVTMRTKRSLASPSFVPVQSISNTSLKFSSINFHSNATSEQIISTKTLSFKSHETIMNSTYQLPTSYYLKSNSSESLLMTATTSSQNSSTENLQITSSMDPIKKASSMNIALYSRSVLNTASSPTMNTSFQHLTTTVEAKKVLTSTLSKRLSSIGSDLATGSIIGSMSNTSASSSKFHFSTVLVAFNVSTYMLKKVSSAVQSKSAVESETIQTSFLSSRYLFPDSNASSSNIGLHISTSSNSPKSSVRSESISSAFRNSSISSMTVVGSLSSSMHIISSNSLKTMLSDTSIRFQRSISNSPFMNRSHSNSVVPKMFSTSIYMNVSKSVSQFATESQIDSVSILSSQVEPSKSRLESQTFSFSRISINASVSTQLKQTFIKPNSTSFPRGSNSTSSQSVKILKTDLISTQTKINTQSVSQTLSVSFISSPKVLRSSFVSSILNNTLKINYSFVETKLSSFDGFTLNIFSTSRSLTTSSVAQASPSSSQQSAFTSSFTFILHSSLALTTSIENITANSSPTTTRLNEVSSSQDLLLSKRTELPSSLITTKLESKLPSTTLTSQRTSILDQLKSIVVSRSTGGLSMQNSKTLFSSEALLSLLETTMISSSKENLDTASFITKTNLVSQVQSRSSYSALPDSFSKHSTSLLFTSTKAFPKSSELPPVTNLTSSSHTETSSIESRKTSKVKESSESRKEIPSIQTTILKIFTSTAFSSKKISSPPYMPEITSKSISSVASKRNTESSFMSSEVFFSTFASRKQTTSLLKSSLNKITSAAVSKDSTAKIIVSSKKSSKLSSIFPASTLPVDKSSISSSVIVQKLSTTLVIDSLQESLSLSTISLVSSVTLSNLNNENKLTMALRVPLSQNISSPAFKNRIQQSLQQLYITGSQAKRKRRATKDTPEILIDSLSRRSDNNETVDVNFFVVKNNTAVTGSEATENFNKVTLAQMDNIIGYSVLSKPAPVTATTTETPTTEKTELALWILVVAIASPIIFVLLLCNIVCFMKYRATKQMKLEPLSDNNNLVEEKPFKQYDIFQANKRNNENMEVGMRTSWKKIDTENLIGMDADPMYSLVKRSPSKKRNRRRRSYAIKDNKDNDKIATKEETLPKPPESLDFEKAKAGEIMMLTRFNKKLQVDPMFNNTGVRFRINVLPEEKHSLKNSRNKFLPPLPFDIKSMKKTSLNKELFSDVDGNSQIANQNHYDVAEGNPDKLTEQEMIVMKERETLEKIRNKERMRTREKAKFERKLKKMSSKVDIIDTSKTIDEISTPLVPDVKYKKRSSKKKSPRRRIAMNAISPSESMETDSESQNTKRGNSQNSYDLNEISRMRPFSSSFNTPNAVSPYPLAPAFPLAAASLYNQPAFQQTYDLLRQASFDDRASVALNSSLNASWNPKNSTDKSSFVPMILPNGRCQPRSTVRLVAENELELLEKAQQRARRKMQYVLQKSVSESTNVTMSEC